MKASPFPRQAQTLSGGTNYAKVGVCVYMSKTMNLNKKQEHGPPQEEAKPKDEKLSSQLISKGLYNIALDHYSHQYCDSNFAGCSEKSPGWQDSGYNRGSATQCFTHHGSPKLKEQNQEESWEKSWLCQTLD